MLNVVGKKMRSINHWVLLHFQQKSTKNFQSLINGLASFPFHGSSPYHCGANSCIPSLNVSWSSPLPVQICLELSEKLKLNRASLKDAVLYHFGFIWLSKNRGHLRRDRFIHPKWIQTTRLKENSCVLYVTKLYFCLLAWILKDWVCFPGHVVYIFPFLIYKLLI